MHITDDIDWQSKYILGVEWDRSNSSPALTRVDVDGTPIGELGYDIDDHPIYSRMMRCTLTDEGIAAYGTNARGDGLTLDGSAGRVMVSIPAFYMKVAHPSVNVWRWWLSPSPYDGFTIYPLFLQSHDSTLKGVVKGLCYIGAYEASTKYKAIDDNTIQFDSRYEEGATSAACTQPITGGSAGAPCLFDVGYTNGSREFIVGETLTNNTLDAEVHDWTVTGGGFGAGSAVGHLLMQVYDDPWGGGNWAAGNIADSGPIVIAQSAGAPTHLSLDMSDCRTYSETNIGGRWGFENVWTMSAIQMLYIQEYANFHSRSPTYGIGKGIMDMANGTGFAGKCCGADATNTAIGTNGTGSGSGTDGITPVVYRGIENPWGNVWCAIDGYNAVDAEYRIINLDGTGTFANTLTAGNYDASSMAPLTSVGLAGGYVDSIEYDDLMKFLLVASSVGGTATTYLTNYFWMHDAGVTSVLQVGGKWDACRTGLIYLFSSYDASFSFRGVGTRLEFL